MNLSGILVVTPPAQLDECLFALNRLPGVEVHHLERESGKIVAVQEAVTIEAEIEGLRRIKALPQVAVAEMVYHYFAEDEQLITRRPADLGPEGPTDYDVPHQLLD